MGVGTGRSGAQDPGIDSFNRNDKTDRRFVCAARLAMTLALPQYRTGYGVGTILAPRLTDGQLRSLFEAAAGGLYRAALPDRSWNVRTSTRLSWPMSSATPGMAMLLPGMKTDIIVETWQHGTASSTTRSSRPFSGARTTVRKVQERTSVPVLHLP